METNNEARTAATSNKHAFLAEAARQSVAYPNKATCDIDVALNCPLSLCNGKTVSMQAYRDNRGVRVYRIEIWRDARFLSEDNFASSAEAMCWWCEYENGNFV